MITPAKRYFVAQTTTSKRICICGFEEIAALLNANKIQEDYVAREWTGLASGRVIKNADVPWVTISGLLAAAYKNKPLITVVLKDVENNTLFLSERYHSDDEPWQVTCAAMENYFDQHYKEFAKMPQKELLLYYKSDKCLPSVSTIKLKVGNHTVYKGTIGSKYGPAEENYPYTYDVSEPREILPPDEFPSVALKLKPAIIADLKQEGWSEDQPFPRDEQHYQRMGLF